KPSSSSTEHALIIELGHRDLKAGPRLARSPSFSLLNINHGHITHTRLILPLGQEHPPTRFHILALPTRGARTVPRTSRKEGQEEAAPDIPSPLPSRWSSAISVLTHLSAPSATSVLALFPLRGGLAKHLSAPHLRGFGRGRLGPFFSCTLLDERFGRPTLFAAGRRCGLGAVDRSTTTDSAGPHSPALLSPVPQAIPARIVRPRRHRALASARDLNAHGDHHHRSYPMAPSSAG
ncbi:hypothetical protein A4X13_0g9388, partial [Tilletia indica]